MTSLGAEALSEITHITTGHRRFDVRIFQKEAKHLARLGHDVSLIVADGDIDEIAEGVKIYSIGWKPKHRLLRFLLAPWLVLAKTLSVRSSLVHFHDPDLLVIAPFLKLCGKKVVYDAHEHLPEQIMGKSWIPDVLRSPMAVTLGCLEILVARLLDGAVGATDHITIRLSKGSNTPAVTLSNYPALSEFHESANAKDDHRTVCYVGGISEERGISVLVRSMAKVDGCLILAGQIPSKYRSELEQLGGWPKVREVGYVSRDQVIELLCNSCVGVVTLLDFPNHVNSNPIKLYEYMAAGLPVVASNFPNWLRLIDEHRCGVCVDPTSEDEVSAAITRLLDNQEESGLMGARGKQAVLQEFNWESQIPKLTDLYARILQTKVAA